MMNAFLAIPQFKQCRPVFCYHYMLHCTSVNYHMEIKKITVTFIQFSGIFDSFHYSTKANSLMLFSLTCLCQCIMTLHNLLFVFTFKTKWQINILKNMCKYYVSTHCDFKMLPMALNRQTGDGPNCVWVLGGVHPCPKSSGQHMAET